MTLSGGGFRATIFHLGVLGYLRVSGKLPHVRVITAVSGGSITAAHLAVNWDRYSGTSEQFQEAADELIRFVQLGVREHIITWLPYVWMMGRWLPRRFATNQATMLRALYDRELFEKRSLGAMSKHAGTPEIYLAATNLSRPDNLVTFASSGVRLHGNQGVHIPTQVVSIAHAVAASSAFPLLFPAISIDTDALATTADILTPSPQYLTDGGVYDNFGLRALRYLRAGKPKLDTVIISDAGARAGWAPNASFRSLSLLDRSSAITSQRGGDLEQDASTEEIARHKEVVSIREVVAGSNGLGEDLQRQLGAVRTDLDSFSDLLVHCLGSHGYAVARHKLGGKADVPPFWNPLAPKNPTSADSQRDVKQLRKEALRPWKILNVKEWKPIVLYLLVLVALYFFLGPFVHVVGDTISEWYREWGRSSWVQADIEPTRLVFGDSAFLGSLHAGMSDREIEEFQMTRWYRWINDGIRPTNKTEQVVVIEAGPFDRNYRDIACSILSDKQVKLAEGVAFLMSTDGPRSTYRPTYRQMRMRFDPEGNAPAELVLRTPTRGERLLIIIRVVSKNQDNLSSEVASFGIKLRVK